MKKKNILLIITSIFLSLFFVACSTASERVLNEINESNYEIAREIYNEDVVGNAEFEAEVRIGLEDKISTCIEDYNNGKVTKSEIEVIFETIKKSELLSSQTVDSAYTEFTELTNSKSSYEMAEKLFESSEYIEAIEYYELVVDFDYNKDIAKSKIDESRTKYKDDILLQVEEAIQIDRYDRAFAILETAYNVLENDLDLDKALTNCEIAYEEYSVKLAINNSNGLLEDKKYSQAYNILLEESLNFPDNIDIVDSLLTCKTIYVEHTLEQAEIALNQDKDYEKSIEIIKANLVDIPDESILIDAMNSYILYRPTHIGDLESFQEIDGSFITASKDIKSNMGDTYESAFYAYIPSFNYFKRASIIYKLNGNYDDISGKAIVDYDHKDYENSVGAFRFYADDVEIFDSGALYGSNEPIDFSFSLTGVQELIIEADNFGKNHGYLVDTFIVKNLQ